VQRVETSGPAIAPFLSEDGLQVAFSRPKYSELLVADMRTGSLRSVPCETSYGARFVGRDVVTRDRDGTRTVHGADGRVSQLAPDRGRNETGAAANGCTYFQENDAVWSRCAGTVRRVTDETDRFYSPDLSPDGTRLLARGLHHGLYVLDLSPTASGASPKLRKLGPGSAPRWMPDSHHVIFNLSRDDGKRIIDSELHLVDVRTGRSHPITDTPDIHEISPSPSGDGRRIAFEADMSVFVADLSGCTD
jgi:Tol biopolymer transport system component